MCCSPLVAFPVVIYTVDFGVGVVRFILQQLLAQQKERDATHAHLTRAFSLDVNDRDSNGRTPMHLAAANNHASALKCLLLHGADPDIKDDAGTTCLVIATTAGASSAVRILSDASVLFWNSSVRANRLYNDKKFEAAISAYSSSITLASDKSLVCSMWF